jgi:pimeloyl-ACP methyl ester carboxylesterase
VKGKRYDGLPMEPKTGSVHLEDTDLFVVRVGSGSPILMCGGPQLGHTYMRSLDVIADDYELIYYDARGTGRSALGDESKQTLAGAVEDLEALRAALGIERLVVLGHSLGGHIGYLYAASHPTRVAALVLVDVGPPIDRDQARQLHKAMVALRTEQDDVRLKELQASEAFARRDPGVIEAFIRNIYTPFFRDRRAIDTVDFAFTEITAANVLDYEERLVASLPHANPLQAMAAIHSPALVVHGEIDPIPVAFGRFVADTIPGAEFAALPGASHFPFVEDADLFERTVRSFLGRMAQA